MHIRWSVLNKKIWIAIAVLAIGSVMRSEPERVVSPTYKVIPGARFCADRKLKLLKVPGEFSGLNALQTNMKDKQGAISTIRLEQPSRVYGVLNWTRSLDASNWGHNPEGWRLYRQAVPGIIKGMDCNIYYLDLPVGDNTIKANSAWVCLGIKPLSQLTSIEKNIIVFTPAAAGGIYAPGSRIGGRLNAPAQWQVTDATGKCIASGQSAEVECPEAPPGLYLLRVKDQGLTVPLYLKARNQVRSPSVKDRIPICLDIRGIAEYWHDPGATRPVLYAAAATMVEYGANLAYANLTADELDIFQEFGISVIMDVRRDIPREVCGSPALFGWFDSKVIDKNDPMISLKRYQEQKARPEISKHLLLYKPMSFNASWLGSGGTRDAMNLWSVLKPPVRTLRCTPFNGPFNAQISQANNGADLESDFGITDICADTPWYMMFSAYGSLAPPDRLTIGRRIPDRSEITALCHIALANGAKAIFVYRAAQADSLISPVTGSPRTGSIHGLNDIADFLKQNSSVLTSSKPTNIKIYCANPVVKIIARRVNRNNYIYVVNLDAKQAVNAQIVLWPKRRSTENTIIKVLLPPGGAKLLPANQ